MIGVALSVSAVEPPVMVTAGATVSTVSCSVAVLVFPGRIGDGGVDLRSPRPCEPG